MIFLDKRYFQARHNRVWDGVDLVMEVVSDDAKDRQRDYEQKLEDYAAAGVAEYWIADPATRAVLVHRLDDGRYAAPGTYRADEVAISALLPEFTVEVAAIFAAAEGIPE